MAERGGSDAMHSRPFDADALELLRSLPREYAARVHELVRERDHLFLLHEALIEVETARTLERRLTIFVNAIRQIGFARAAITLRHVDPHPALSVTAGMTDQERVSLSAMPDAFADWERRRLLLERFRVSQSFYLDGADPWVTHEFAVPGNVSVGAAWGEGDVLLVPLRDSHGELLATLLLAEPREGRRPSIGRVRTVELFAQQVAYHLEQERLTELATLRAERLQQLNQVGSALARSLDEREIALELARGVTRILQCDGIVIAQPDLERNAIATLVRLVNGEEHPAPDATLGSGPIAEVARSGQPVLINAYEPDLSPLAAADDVMSDGKPAGSVLAVPLRVGLRLMGVLAVHSASRDAFRSEDVDLLVTMGAQAASAMSNARLYAESQREQREGQALADVARAVSESLRTGEVLRLILRHALALLRTDGAYISLKSDDYLHVVAAAGTGELLAGIHIPIANSISGRAVRDGAPIISNDVAANPQAYRTTQRIVRIDRAVDVPLIAARGPIGVLSVFNRAEEFTETDALVLQRLADHVAVAIVNARLYEEVAEATREWSIAFNAVATGMAVLDDAGRIARYNSRALQLAASETNRELVGRQFYEAILHEPREIGNACPLDLALREGIVGRMSIRSAARGKLFDVMASPHPNGGAVVTFDDVTASVALAERHKLIVETATDAILIIDPDRRISYANPAAMELFGRRGTLSGASMRDLIVPEVTEDVESRETQTFEGVPQRFECTVLRADGERRVVSVSQAPLRELGRVTGIVAALRDMTDERRARDAVAQSEARYRNLFETATDAIYTLDAQGALTSANQATHELLHVPREELLGRPLVRHIDESERDVVIAWFRDALEGQSRRYECTLVRPNGERRLLSVTNSPIRHGRRVLGVLGVARDITEERERARALERSEARYTNLLESASDAIFTVDDEGIFTSANRALEKATGKTRDRLIDTHFSDVIDQRDRDRVWEVFVGALHGKQQRHELRYIDAQGASRPASIITSPIVEGGTVTGVLGVVRDVTEEKLLVEQVLQQEKVAAISQLVSGVAHELNNPLASVMAFTQLLLGTENSAAEQQDALQTIHEEARRAAKIVANLLTFAREHPLQRTLTNVSDLVASTLDVRAHALHVHGVTLDRALDPAIPPTWADGFQLQQVFLNLLANAEQALDGWTGERRISVSTSYDSDAIIISVADTGPGIAASEVDRIFNPFYTTRPVGKGTGLGLSISDGIVREHGGTIRVESEPGKGTTMIVEFPVVPPPGVPRPPSFTPGGRRRRPGAQHILVVDDEPAIRAAISRYFGGLGHSVDAVGSAIEALARLDGQRYDVILLDLRMPDMSGEALYQELLQRDPQHAACTVFLTGDVRGVDSQAFLERAGRPSVEKPFNFDDLARVVLEEMAS
jgi:PAS domain S-box-containing protein